MFKLSIQNKLIVAFSTITVLFCIALWLALSGMQNANQSFNNYFEKNQVLLTEIQDMYGNGLLSGIALRNLVLNPKLKKPFIVIPKAIKKFDDGYKRVQSLAANNPALLESLAKVDKNWQISKAAKLRTLEFMKQSNLDKAVLTLTKQEHPSWRKVRVGLNGIVEHESKNILVLRDKLNSDSRSTLTFTLVIALIAILCGVILGTLVTLTIKRSFNNVTKSLDDIASGEGDLTQRLDDSGKDEVATL
jgi:methyl-accepting chemotaxis protein